MMLLAVVLFGTTACNAADGSEFIGTWDCPFVKVQISHNSGNQYFVALSPFDAAQPLAREPAFFNNGMLELNNGNKLIIDRQTGKLNLGGYDCPRK